MRKRYLAPATHQPHRVRRVREFLLFAPEHEGDTFEQTLSLFLGEVGKRMGIKPWQVQQAGDAVRIYRYQYRAAGAAQAPAAGEQAEPMDDAGLLTRLREVIRLRHYARCPLEAL